ncbi:hypothetical protein BH24DEI2_BH24DEI2_06760 [soil metagenome]
MKSVEASLSARQKYVAHSYRVVQGLALKLRVYAPNANPTGGAIVFFYGGGWRNGDIEQFAPQSRYLAARGLLAVCAEYRVANRHGTTPFEALEDVCASLGWLRERADALGFAPERLVAAGGSAGGHLALCAALFGSVHLGALVLFNPVLDTSEAGFGAERFSGRGLELSPLQHVKPGLPPTLILQGTADDTTPPTTARHFCELMSAVGNRCELANYVGAEHGFFNPDRHEGRFYKTTLHRTEQFLTSLGYLEGAL